MARRDKKSKANDSLTPTERKSPNLVIWLAAWIFAMLQGLAASSALFIVGKSLFYDKGDTFHPAVAAVALFVAIMLTVTLFGHVAFLNSMIAELELAGHNMRLARKLQKIFMTLLEGL
jgi:hypothetical protein